MMGFHCVAEELSVPYDYELYLKKQYCEAKSIEFNSKVDIAVKMLEDFGLAKEYLTYFLIDSWFTSPKLIYEAFKLGYQTIGALKSNRVFYPQGIRQSLANSSSILKNQTLTLLQSTV